MSTCPLARSSRLLPQALSISCSALVTSSLSIVVCERHRQLAYGAASGFFTSAETMVRVKRISLKRADNDSCALGMVVEYWVLLPSARSMMTGGVV